MNTNDIILDGINAILNQIVATAVDEAVKPLKERILALEDGYMDWKGVEHVAAKAMQPLQDRVIALEINQSMGKAEFTLPDVDLNEAVRNVLDGYNFVNKNEVIDLVESVVDKAVESAIDAYDFSDSVDWDSKIEEGINNYDFSDIIQEITHDAVDEDRVQEMIDETLDNCTIRRG